MPDQLGQAQCQLNAAQFELQALRSRLEARQAAVEVLLERLEEANARKAGRTAAVQDTSLRMPAGRYDFGAARDAEPASGGRDARDRYAQAFQVLLSGDEHAALAGFQSVVKQSADPDLTARARLWVAELLLRSGQQAAAAVELEALRESPLPQAVVEPLRKRVLGKEGFAAESTR